MFDVLLGYDTVLYSGGNLKGLQLWQGDNVPLSPPDTGRIRYNKSTGRIEFSENGGVYTTPGLAAAGWVRVGSVVRLGVMTDTVAIGATGMVGSEKERIVGLLRIDDLANEKGGIELTNGDLLGVSLAHTGRIRYNLVTDQFEVSQNGSAYGPLGTLDPATHETLRQLIHFIDEGPANGFLSGAYREVTGTLYRRLSPGTIAQRRGTRRLSRNSSPGRASCRRPSPGTCTTRLERSSPRSRISSPTLASTRRIARG